MNKNFCPICTAPTFKPSCPRCESSKTRFVGHVGHNFWLAILFFSIGGVIINGSENIRSGRGIFTNEDLLILLFAVPIFLASLVFFFKPLSRDVKRVLCQSCNTESFIADIHAFQQSIYGQDTPVNLTTLIQAAFDKNTGTGENSPEPTGAIQRYLANGYDLISETKNTENNITTEKTPELNEKPPNKVIMERRSPINPIMMLAWVIMFWPIAIYYAIPEKRKLYRVQLEITDDGQLVESGGTIEQLEKDKKRARKTGWILLGISIPVFICIITIGLSGGFDAN